MTLLPALDRHGVRIVAGDIVLIERGRVNQITARVLELNGVMVRVMYTFDGKDPIPPHKAEWVWWESKDLEVLR